MIPGLSPGRYRTGINQPNIDKHEFTLGAIEKIGVNSSSLLAEAVVCNFDTKSKISYLYEKDQRLSVQQGGFTATCHLRHTNRITKIDSPTEEANQKRQS